MSDAEYIRYREKPENRETTLCDQYTPIYKWNEKHRNGVVENPLQKYFQNHGACYSRSYNDSKIKQKEKKKKLHFNYVMNAEKINEYEMYCMAMIDNNLNS